MKHFWDSLGIWLEDAEGGKYGGAVAWGGEG